MTDVVLVGEGCASREAEVEVLSWLQGHAPAVHTTTPHPQQAHTAGSLAHLLGPADFVAYVLHVVLGKAIAIVR